MSNASTLTRDQLVQLTARLQGLKSGGAQAQRVPPSRAQLPEWVFRSNVTSDSGRT